MESKPYFETVKSFADVPITEDGVETHSFLEASDGLVKLFDLLGSGVFAFVQADIRGNIGGVRSRYQNASASSITLENLVRSETSTEQHPHATGCLVRLTRGLMFLCKALQHMQNEPSSELHVCFKHSYDEVLRRHHSFVVRSLAAVCHTSNGFFRISPMLGLKGSLITIDVLNNMLLFRSQSAQFHTAETSLLASHKVATGRSLIQSSEDGLLGWMSS
ncbi:glycolipid transfer protein domain-containing protein [Pisolithus croceorrhizus]|nr:glycolipid transfer protein domain-containing protein [Pisolithus croceorrhizus]